MHSRGLYEARDVGSENRADHIFAYIAINQNKRYYFPIFLLMVFKKEIAYIVTTQNKQYYFPIFLLMICFQTLRRWRENLICGVLFNIIQFSLKSGKIQNIAAQKHSKVLFNIIQFSLKSGKI